MAENIPEVKVASTQPTSSEVGSVLELPECYARYVDEKCWQLVDSKKTPNREFITYLINTTSARFRARYPVLDDNFTIKIEISGQMQILMLARILCVSALTSKLTDAIANSSILTSDICQKFHIASIEHDAWAWFSGAIGPNEKCSSLMSIAIPNELTYIADIIIAIENASIAIPGSTILPFSDGDRIVECALFAIVDSLSRLIFDFWSPCVDLDAKTKLQLSSSDISGLLRLFNHGRIPARSQFFIELGQFGNQFETIKKGIKAKDAAMKPAKVGGRKKK